ncbi:MAG: phage Gp37/Gp68 family protein [Clostridiales bacterium]|nr:phage Gp37/Gp68 family protein [Clostridiales bacterium]
MNRSRIEWCDHTWNPITGCLHGCPYCYARRATVRFAGDVRLNKMCTADYRTTKARNGDQTLYILDKPMKNEDGNTLVYPFGFEPTFHRYRMDTLSNLKMGNNVFVGAMADVFGDWVPDEWIDEIFTECERRPEHNYLFLTKNVCRYAEYGVPAGTDNLWYGTSITKEEEMSRFNSLPAGCKTFISFEPLLEDLYPERHNILFRQVDWIIIGAQTGRQADKVIPQFEWVKKLVLAADERGVPVFMKDSLIEIVGEKNMRRDYPTQLMTKTMSQKLHNKLYGRCNVCGEMLKKSEMTALLARSARGKTPKQFAYLCKSCMKDICNKWGIPQENKKMED